MTNDAKNIGFRGCKYVATGGAVTIKAWMVELLEDSEVSSIKDDGVEFLSVIGISGITLPAGTKLTSSSNGFTSITLASGSAMSYNS